MPSSRIRLGFDVGSGATKVCCEYRVVVPSGTNADAAKRGSTSPTATVVFEQEVILLVGQRTREYSEARGDLLANNRELVIPMELQDVLEDTLLTLLSKSIVACLPYFGNHKERFADAVRSGQCEVEAVATATAIFRLASNGTAVLERLNRNLGLSCQLLPQDREAELGYLTALSVQDPTAAGSTPLRQLVSWDSGGASFQLATVQADGARTPLEMFNGLWGNSVTHLDLLALQKLSSPAVHRKEDDPNPVGIEMANRLHQHIISDFNEPTRHSAAAIATFRELFKRGPDRVRLHGIGGPSSAFKITALVTGKFTGITPADVWSGIERFVPLSSEEMGAITYADLPNPPKEAIDLTHRPFSQPKVLISKLVLVYTVLQHLGVHSFDFTETIGNTRAIVAMDELWGDDVPEVVAQKALSPLSPLRAKVISTLFDSAGTHRHSAL